MVTLPTHCLQCGTVLPSDDGFTYCPSCTTTINEEFLTCYRLVEGQDYERDAVGQLDTFLTDAAFHGYAIWLALLAHEQHGGDPADKGYLVNRLTELLGD